MSDIQHYLKQRSLKFKLHIKKCSNSSSKASEDKSKQIAKYKLSKCSQNCLKHRFSFSRIKNNKEKHKLAFEKYEVTYNFCPYHNELIDIHEGGAPRFNNDKRIETPGFVIKFETLTDSDGIYKEIFKDVLARATNQTLLSSNQKHKVECDKKASLIDKSNQFQNKVLELKQILMRKDEEFIKSISKLQN